MKKQGWGLWGINVLEGFLTSHLVCEQAVLHVNICVGCTVWKELFNNLHLLFVLADVALKKQRRKMITCRRSPVKTRL